MSIFRYLMLACCAMFAATGLRAQQAAASAPTSPQAVPGYEVQKAMPLFYPQMLQQLTWPMAWANAGIDDFGQWRQQGRQVLTRLMQTLPPAPQSYDMQVVAEEQRDGYRALRILFNVSGWSRIPALLLIPDGSGPFPALVALHDHGAKFSIGKEKMIRPVAATPEVMADAQDWADRNYDGQFVGDVMARHGYVVLAIDALMWGERGREQGPDYQAQQAIAANFMQMGCVWSALINMDDVRSAEFLASLPMVDARRVGCFGHSMGSYRSWMLSALSDVVAASANVCWMCTTPVLMDPVTSENKGGSAYSMLIPGLRNYMDYPHVASLACPKPTLFFNGRQDKLFPVHGVEDAYAQMRQVWQSQGADERLVTQLWEGPHFFSQPMQQEVLRFFDRWLKGGR